MESQFGFLCATSVFSVTLWLLYLEFLQPQRHREHRGCTERKLKLRQMKWEKKGVIFTPDRNYDWMVSHASVPVVDEARPGVLRIYFGTRDRGGRSQTSYIEVDAKQPEKVLYIHDQPILSLGKPGSFDDSGIMPSWLVNWQNKKYLYYIGWNVTVSVPYHLAIGLARSDDGGQSFRRFRTDQSSIVPSTNRSSTPHRVSFLKRNTGVCGMCHAPAGSRLANALSRVTP